MRIVIEFGVQDVIVGGVERDTGINLTNSYLSLVKTSLSPIKWRLGFVRTV